MARQECRKVADMASKRLSAHDWQFALCEVMDDRYLANGNELGVISGSVLNAAKPEGWEGNRLGQTVRPSKSTAALTAISPNGARDTRVPCF
jgi:hypothetical protein